MQRDCKEHVKCEDCGSEKHAIALHIDDEEHDRAPTKCLSIRTKCTQICRDRFSGKSCAKVILVRVFPDGQPEKSVNVYAMLDDQSNRSLAKSGLFHLLDIHGEEIQYTLSSCNGRFDTFGRRASGCAVVALDGSARHKLPVLIECDQIPTANMRYPPQKMLLMGRDVIEAHHVHDQLIGPRRTPIRTEAESWLGHHRRNMPW